MNTQDRQRIRKEILQLMTPPVSFRMKKPETLFHVFYLLTGFCLFFTGIQVGMLSTEQNLMTYEQPESLLNSPVSQPVYYINDTAIPSGTSGRKYPELPEIELIYVENSI